MKPRGRPSKSRKVVFDDSTGDIEQHEEVMSLDDEQPQDDELRNTPIPETEQPIPLFDALNIPDDVRPAYIGVTKWEKGDKSYKGQMPVEVREEHIAEKFGNGYFDLVLYNAQSRVIRRRAGIKIDIPDIGISPPAQAALAPVSGIGAPDVQSFIKDEREARNKLFDVERMTLREHASENQRRADAYLAMIAKSQEVEAQRSRDFYGSQSRAMGETFAQMMSMQQQGFQQTIQMMQLQSMQQAQMPAMLLNVFKQGMDLAPGNDDEQQDPSMSIIGEGMKMLGKLPDLAMANMMLKQQAPTRQKVANVANRPVPTKSNPGMPKMPSAPGTAPAAKPKAVITLSDAEKQEIAALKVLCDERGLDFAFLAKQARAQLSGTTPPEPAPESDPTDEEDDSLFDDEEEDDFDDMEDDDDDGEDDSEESSPDAEPNHVESKVDSRKRRPSARAVAVRDGVDGPAGTT